MMDRFSWLAVLLLTISLPLVGSGAVAQVLLDEDFSDGTIDDAAIMLNPDSAVNAGIAVGARTGNNGGNTGLLRQFGTNTNTEGSFVRVFEKAITPVSLGDDEVLILEHTGFIDAADGSQERHKLQFQTIGTDASGQASSLQLVHVAHTKIADPPNGFTSTDWGAVQNDTTTVNHKAIGIPSGTGIHAWDVADGLQIAEQDALYNVVATFRPGADTGTGQNLNSTNVEYLLNSSFVGQGDLSQPRPTEITGLDGFILRNRDDFSQFFASGADNTDYTNGWTDLSARIVHKTDFNADGVTTVLGDASLMLGNINQPAPDGGHAHATGDSSNDGLVTLLGDGNDIIDVFDNPGAGSLAFGNGGATPSAIWDRPSGKVTIFAEDVILLGLRGQGLITGPDADGNSDIGSLEDIGAVPNEIAWTVDLFTDFSADGVMLDLITPGAGGELSLLYRRSGGALEELRVASIPEPASAVMLVAAALVVAAGLARSAPSEENFKSHA